MQNERLETIRTSVLSQMERAERIMRLGIMAAAVLEMTMIAIVVLMFDLKDRVQLLIFVTSMLSYSIIVLGLFALGAHVTRTAGRIVSLMDPEPRG
jgi:hypothetical protein